MSNILDLPIYKVEAGVQSDEDWNLVFAFYLADGVTPIDLTGIAFTANVWNSPTTSFAVVGATSGGTNNILTFAASQAAKASWPDGVYPFTILAIDENTGAKRDLLGWSTLTIGAPQLVCSTQLLSGAGEQNNLLSVIPQALTAQAIMGTLPQELIDGIPSSGFYINESGYLVMVQTQ